MFSCVPARSVAYYLADPTGDQLEYYWGGKQGIWWTPDNANPEAQVRFSDCRDGEPIDNDVFVRLTNGHLPDGSTVARGGSGIRMPGYDCHFAPPKSVSLVFAFSNAAIRQQIVELHIQAVRRALQFVFDWGFIGARRGSAGKTRENVAALVAAIFTEFTSRENDPQLHSHAFIPNLAVRSDGTIGAIDNFRVTIFQHLIGAIYQAQLSHGLRKMGFTLENNGRAFEIQSVPKALIKAFSKRRNTIERVAKALGVDPSRNRSAADMIALDTRPAKSAELLPEQLEARWWTQLRAAGFDASFTAPVSTGHEPPAAFPTMMAEQAVAEAFETDAVLSKAKLFSVVAERLIGQCGANEVEQQLLHTVPSQLVALSESEQTGNTQYATRTLIEMEKELLRLARAGRGFRRFVADHYIEAAIAARPSLSQEQRDAVRHALNSDQIAITEGSAGSGKSFKLAAVADACRASGLDVWALGPSWSATQVLAADTQMPDQRTRALSGFLTDVEAGRIHLPEQTVILLDEAGMVGTEDLQRLAAIVHQAGCKLVLSGDTMQLQPVAAGAPMRLLARVLGTSRMAQIRRQKLAWSRAASMEFAKGRTDRALKVYHMRGHISWVSGRAATFAALADRYVADLVADREATPQGPLPTCLAIASRNADVTDLNDKIRSRLQSAGFVSPQNVALHVALRVKGRNKKKQAGTMQLAVGDRVVFGETVVLTDRTIRNADVAKVVAIGAGPSPRLTLAFEADGIQATHEVKDLVGFRAEGDVQLPLLRHAYAGTAHFSQGHTVDRAYVASIHAMSREAMYVAMTRHRDGAQLFVDTTRFKAASLSGLPKVLLTLLKGQEKQATRTAAQLEAKRQAFYEESLRPDSKVNASDFVADLDTMLDPQPLTPEHSLSRYEALKAATLRRATARGQAELGEAARFENPVSGTPNWLYRVINVPKAAVHQQSTYWRAIAARIGERIAATLSPLRAHGSLTARTYLLKSTREVSLQSADRGVADPVIEPVESEPGPEPTP